MLYQLLKKYLLIILVLAAPVTLKAQLNWLNDGNSYLTQEDGAIIKVTMPGYVKTKLVDEKDFIAQGQASPLKFFKYTFSDNLKKVLLFSAASRSYHNTFSANWVYDLEKRTMKPVGKKMGNQLLNTKLSPDGSKVAFVYQNNIYVQDLGTSAISQLTLDGNDKRLNGLFDYAYSEELFCTDGFRWSPDSKKISFWQNDISKIKKFYMINNTDQLYPVMVPLAFSKPGEPIAAAKIGVITIATKAVKWMNIPGDAAANYIPRAEWLPDGSRLIVQQLNRKQNESKLFLCSPTNATTTLLYKENDEAWIDVKKFWMRGGSDWDWIDDGKAFIWASEQDGWRHLYRISLDGKQTLLTKGDYDVTNYNGYDAKNKLIYFTASPDVSTQRYLFRIKMDDPAHKEQLSAADLPGTHNYNLSPNALWGQHSFSSHLYQSASEFISLPANTQLDPKKSIAKTLVKAQDGNNTTFFTVTTAEGIKMDGWMVKPKNFDPSKKYPVVFTVYSEPFSTTVNDVANLSKRANFFEVDSGYIFMSVEGRGAPAPKGRAWRKAIYRNMGWINSNDQAMAVKEIIKWPFIDPSRVAVFGGSGGGSTTMQLLFRYPELYQTGIASSGVPTQFVYNNIYTERYMGLLPENKADYTRVSPITYAKNLQGHLLILHGTGDHNVHYQGEEMLLNELIKYNRQFVFMPYPNRTHGITEGEGTRQHKTTLSANFLKQYCPPGGR